MDRVDDAVPVAQAVASGGLRLVEVTLRTCAGLDAVAALAAQDTPSGLTVG